MPLRPTVVNTVGTITLFVVQYPMNATWQPLVASKIGPQLILARETHPKTGILPRFLGAKDTASC